MGIPVVAVGVVDSHEKYNSMKEHMLTGMAALFFLAAVTTVVSPALAAEYPWELKKDEDGIRVSVRKVEDSPILEYKGTVTVDAKVEETTRFFEEDARMTEWFHNCTEARTLRTETPDQKTLYFVIDMPWPVQDRDLVFRRVCTRDPATGTVVYETSALPQNYPEQEGKVRMPSMKGLWRFTPLSDGRTEIYYQQHSEVGGHIPDWLVNRLAVNIPFNSLSRFRQLLSKTK